MKLPALLVADDPTLGGSADCDLKLRVRDGSPETTTWPVIRPSDPMAERAWSTSATTARPVPETTGSGLSPIDATAFLGECLCAAGARAA